MSAGVRMLGPDDVGALARFFAAIEADAGAVGYFHPHPFDEATAETICTRTGRDEYFAVFDEGEVVGYGMLRGWDEGYEVPAFGVCVRGDQRGRGLGHVLLGFAIDRARDAGAPSVMLKVFDDNLPARALYESFGFTFSERTPDGAQLVGRLDLGERRLP